MSSLDQSPITDGINGLLTSAKGLLGTPIAAALTGAVAGAATVGAGVLAVGALTRSKSKTSSSSRKYGRGKIKHTARGWKQDRARRSKQKWEVAYQKRKRKLKRLKSRSSKRVKYTKNGQPYIILSSGKAKFIKKRG